MTRLRKLMLEELQRRNFSSETIRGYLGTVERFAQYFGKPPDRLGPDHIRQWQAHLLHERKLAVGTVVNHVAALRFFFRRALKRRLPIDSIPYPRYSHHRTPHVLSPDEVARLIEAAGTLQARAILMALYSTGMRRSELVCLRVEDIDSERMVIHIRKGKGGKDRDVPLCPRLLETLREYWRWKKPKTWLFPGQPRADGNHLTDKAVWHVCNDAAQHAGIKKRVSPHMLRHSFATHCWKTAPIWRLSKYYWVTPIWRLRASTSIFRGATWKKPSILLSILRSPEPLIVSTPAKDKN